jgi:hypothetical protein
VIIISLVRSRDANLAHDSKFKLGFCDNPKRLNVAISRAKDLLVIVGNGRLFGSNDPNWNSLLTYPFLCSLFSFLFPLSSFLFPLSSFLFSLSFIFNSWQTFQTAQLVQGPSAIMELYPQTWRSW